MTDGQEPPEFSDQKIAHLDMIQRVVERMAVESARMKQFALASIAATASTAAATGSANLALVGSVLAILFWWLDAKYLTQEHWFRNMFDEAREKAGAADFVMTPSQAIREGITVSEKMWDGWSVRYLYLTLIVLSIAISIAIYSAPPTATAG